MLARHPLSAAFPAMSDGDLQALADDIRQHGLREPVTLLDGEVLDGWHRYQACLQAGVDPVTREYDGADPVAYVISCNAHRRHLTASQRAAAVALCAKWAEPGANQHQAGGSALSAEPLTTKKLAEMAGVGTRTVEQAKTAIRAGMGEAVRDGKISARAAAEAAKPTAPTPPAQSATVNARPSDDMLTDEEQAEMAREAAEEMLRENAALHERIAAIDAADQRAEIAKQVAIRQALESQHARLMDQHQILAKEATKLQGICAALRKVLGVESNSAIVPTVKALLAEARA